MSSPLLGRNARLYKDGIVIGHGKSISVKAVAELIKDYDMDSLAPQIVAPGKQTFKWTAEKFYLNGSWMTLILLGHNSLRYVLLYKQISKTYEHGGDGYIVREAKNKAEAKALLEDGFDYVMDKGGVSLYRKLK